MPRVIKKKKRNEEVKLFDFVDSSKAIQGSTDGEDEGKLSRRKKGRTTIAKHEDEEGTKGDTTDAVNEEQINTDAQRQ